MQHCMILHDTDAVTGSAGTHIKKIYADIMQKNELSQATTWKIMEGDVLSKFTKVHHGLLDSFSHVTVPGRSR